MKNPLTTRPTWLAAVLTAAAASTQAQQYLSPADVVLPPETASKEALDQAAGKATLRALGLDWFPRLAASSTYDDNVLVAHANPIRDLEWSILPGITAVAGDVASIFQGSVNLSQLRSLEEYNLVEAEARPQRFVGLEYTPSINFFTDHDQLNNTDHSARLAGGYAFSRLALTLDQDYSRVAYKSTSIATRLLTENYQTRLGARYDINDRSSVVVNGKFSLQDYPQGIYQGYQEFRNEDWFMRKVGEKLDVSVGLAFGYVSPDVATTQTYRQVLLRGIYQIARKVYLSAAGGAEWRDYSSTRSDTYDPVFWLAAVYEPRQTTTVTLYGERRGQPSFDSSYNYQTTGFGLAGRQQLSSSLYLNLSAQYANRDYQRLVLGSGKDFSQADYTARASVDYQPNPHWTASLFYSYVQQDSGIVIYQTANNLAGVQVGWRF